MSAPGLAGPPDNDRHRPLVGTYRVQLRAEFGFAEAVAQVGYLADLGISHLYCSPYLQAAPGSAHGYDVVDPGQVNAELGGAAGREQLCAALAEHGLGQVLDIVPNHMAISGPENRWWWDVLANGRGSRYADHFDIDWNAPGADRPAKIGLPVLGDDLDEVLAAGELQLESTDGGFVVRYHEHTFPIAADTLDGVIPVPVPDVELNADTLRRLLDRQHYRLDHWRSAARELSYRRFFDVTTLIGVRVEDPLVFGDTHRLILGWLNDGSLDGVRIDHIDGLRRPGEYLDRLRAAAGERAWIVVEKILEGDERLPDSWPVAGTTGYDALGPVDGVFVDPAGAAAMTELFAEVCGHPETPPAFADVVYDAKRLVMRDVLAAEVNRLTRLLMTARAAHSLPSHVSDTQMRQTLTAVLAEFSRYRAYVPEDAPAPAAERAVIEEAAVAALTRKPALDKELVRWLVDVLAGRWNTPVAGAESEACVRFQHLSGPVMAKSVEDTAFYRYHRLVSRNEVGGDPEWFASSVDQFHASCAERAERWPEAMTTLTTHDTKRSEDVRARIAVLAEIPDRWTSFVRRWLHDGPVDRPTQYLLLQTMVGAWPLPVERAVAYMEKATREAKLHTSWLAPDEQYDDAVRDLVETWSSDAAFQEALAGFARTVVPAGRINALAQKVIQLTMPGVPDLYQGSELWDLSLVDPDNRRAVDYVLRADTLAILGASGLPLPFDPGADDIGRSKLWAVRQALAVRRRHPTVFAAGSGYQPVFAEGPAAAHVLAFARTEPNGAAATVTAVERLTESLARDGEWAETSLSVPPGRWVDVMTGVEHLVETASVPVADLLGAFPVALLEPAPTQFSTQ